jgi:hypothetical protein
MNISSLEKTLEFTVKLLESYCKWGCNEC